jgi:hypothetical protein
MLKSTSFNLKLKVALTALFFILIPTVARADVMLGVTSYSMFNGGVGEFNYEDTSYLPCPGNNCNTIGGALSGGTGKLTDGVDSSNDWTAGPPEGWVGWETGQANGTDPTVTFNFGSVDTIHSVTVWFDNTLGFGGVGPPAEILIDGTPYIPPQNVDGPQGFTVSGLDITGNSINVQFDQTADPWIMIGEVSFSGTNGINATPEPSSVILLLSILGLVTFSARKHAKSV